MASWLASVVKELGNWVGAAAVQKLVDMGMESHLSKHRQPVDSKAALKRVETALPKIKAVMGVAEALKMKDPSTHTRNWVQQFRDAVDAAEDVLDELKYKELENMVQKQNRGDSVGEGSSSVSKKRKSCAISDDILERLEEAVAMLDEATVGLEELRQRAKELDEYGDLQAIGDQIVKKLHGSPLAAKVIGSLLNSHMDPYFWRRISSHDSLINSQQANNVMEVLKLSYYNLPGDLQVCFMFCSIFSQDHDFFKEDLIKMWMASGFLGQQSWEEQRPEDIGEDYFNILLRKSFFEVSKIKGQGYYVMHDLIHELATNVYEGECCRVGRNDKSIYIPSTIRHVSVHESQIQKVSHLKNIRSLVITTIGEQQDKTVPKYFVLPNNLVIKSLRLLKIHANRCCKLQEEVSYLVHLRYLSIYIPYPLFQYIIHAPIYKLYHLLVLEVIGSEDSEIETTGMANLVNLRYIRFPNLIIKTICGVHMMTSLHEFTFFVGPESGHRINELRTLNNLRSLDIYNIENIRDPSEAASANLLGKENLQSLQLICTTHETNLNNPEQILDNLQPHQNLMELAIRGYKGQRFPMWMMGEMPLLNLSTLKLHQCPYLNNLSSFGQMTSLKELEIYNCPNMDKLPDMPLSLTKFRVHDVGLTALPGLSVHTSTMLPQKSFLRFVYISRCPNLITLNGFLHQDTVQLHGLEDLGITNCENLAQLPMHAFTTCLSLKNLFIEDCPNLTWLPCLPLSLISFKIDGIGVSALPEYFHSSGSSGGPSPSSFIASSIEKIDIWNCPNLISLNGFLEQENIEFRAINEFWVVNCENLIQIPKGGFSKFVSVNYLDIRDCPKLAAVDNHNTLLPSKLRALCMINCGKLDVPLMESSSRLTTLTQLAIFNSPNITRIPSTENVFGSLSKLEIGNCPKLIEIELSLMRQTHNVDRGSNFASLKINFLSIDELALLLIEPLRSLRSVSHLFVSYCSMIDTQRVEQWLLQNSSTLRELTIWNASTLRSLPAAMARLTSLEHLTIQRADLLVELPELPASLKTREIKSSDGADKF
ncbi:Disease resistance protein RGA2 [Rhynchospora pubera]|uniref:Disease resistance protein RGA2 n=1 Tax=Rhynchospora pubera TaxID=906938 RepID=A0AAV8ERH7_9POAL|nr:Disease resistance protein RGA2 [Rhynchospora pubera]